jgi:hypothetical protein
LAAFGATVHELGRRQVGPAERRADFFLAGTGIYATVEEIAAVEKINPSYVGRLLRLTLLAPDLVEGILNGRQPAEVTLAVGNHRKTGLHLSNGFC